MMPDYDDTIIPDSGSGNGTLDPEAQEHLLRFLASKVKSLEVSATHIGEELSILSDLVSASNKRIEQLWRQRTTHQSDMRALLEAVRGVKELLEKKP